MGTPHHLGPVGMGETVKLVNQIIIANVMIANVEGSRLCQASRRRSRRGARRARLGDGFELPSRPNGCRKRGWPERSKADLHSISFARTSPPHSTRLAPSNYPMPATGLAYQLYTTRSAQGDGALDYSAIAKAYERNAGDEAAAAALVKSPDFNKKILVVDDESAILQTLRFNLERSGYAVVTAGDGRSAIAMAQREQPDLIVLDIMLPVLDGVEACKEIRKFSPVPIIMLTAKDQEIDKVLALELGADDYVTKPFALHEFLARVKARLRRQSADSGRARRSDRARRHRARSVAPAAHRAR